MTRLHAQFSARALQQFRGLRHLARHDSHLLANAVRRMV
jgi:hypothetical protein